MDGLTDQQTNGRTKPLIELRVHNLIVTRALDGQRYPLPLQVCGCVMVRGAAAPKGLMIYAVGIWAWKLRNEQD